MLSFLKNNKLLVTLTIAGTIVGLVFFFLSSTHTITRIEYRFPTAHKDQLPATLKTDTFFLETNGLYVRNYLSSIGDSLRSEGISCHELKIQSENELGPSDLDQLKERLFPVEMVDVTTVKKLGKHYNTSIIYLGSIAGLFVGVLLSFVLKMIQPRKNAGNAPT